MGVEGEFRGERERDPSTAKATTTTTKKQLKNEITEKTRNKILFQSDNMQQKHPVTTISKKKKTIWQYQIITATHQQFHNVIIKFKVKKTVREEIGGWGKRVLRKGR